jgi:hypothetical protein
MSESTPTGNGRAGNGDLSGPSETTVAVRPKKRREPSLLWQFWKDYAEKIAHYQTAALLAIIYIFIAGPTALLARLVGHRFLPHLPTGADTFWHEAAMGRPTEPAEYRRQF